MGSVEAGQDQYSGTLTHSAGVLEYTRSGQAVWRLPSDQIAVVGEFTDGSLGDDYFLVFVSEAGECFQASFYAVGRDACLASLAECLGLVVQPGLSNSTEFRSRVLWPPKLFGQALLAPAGPQQSGLASRLASALGFGRIEIALASPILAHLGLPDPKDAV